MPILGRTNWPQFRDAFLDYALSQGKGGMILIKGRDDGIDGDTRRPTFNMTRLEPDPNNPDVMIDTGDRKYLNTSVGVALFNKDEARFEELQQSKMKLISKLLLSMEDDVRAKVETWQGFRKARDEADLVTM